MKIVSLDVWNTLIRANPEFSRERNMYLAAELSLPIDKVNSVYRKVKDTADNMAEEKGECISNMAIYKRFLLLLGRQHYSWLKLRRGLERIFASYPPYVLPETVTALQWLQEQGMALSIASNTNFIRGEVLHNNILNTWGIDWKFQIFSDQLLQAKPHPRFWNIVVKRAKTYVDAMPWEILHIGDNKICDGACSTANIQFQYIKGPAELAHVLERVL